MSDPQHPLAPLLVLDQLTVGPVHLERDRLSAPYRVQAGDREETFTLHYHYPEPVFDPDDPGDQNLAAMIAAQVALNYGLFCHRILFRGPYDAADRRFLREMAANTAREIYVNKFLQENPFLRGPAATLPVVELPTYLLAELRFDPREAPEALSQCPPWAASPERFAVLSSGGKDSLLTYGLLHEAGMEAHPIFVNESGRHWFTALNAYRWFQREVPHTARVWTDCDRLYNGMLRHLPFVREDFNKVRADIYPVRLWTVAVFLFGALPFLKRRGIGCLAIGDEYDTTVRENFQGIPHYAGLYDQSRFFDHALSRYFRRKGWGVSQMSLLRPASELLIQKTLAERYPHLLRLQVSCHAAHTEGEGAEENRRVRPCGRCEKCRRIVAMLLAIGADPGACGYGDAAPLLAGVAREGVHQELAGAQHLAYLLQQRSLLPEGRLGEATAEEHPEVLQLRFHPRISPIHEVPEPPRRRILELLAQHAAGAVRWVGRKWVEFDLEQGWGTDPDFTRLAPSQGSQFAATAEPRESAPDAGDALGEQTQWATLSWPQAKKRLQSMDVALLPVGAIEQHGPHLPLDVDSFDAEYLAQQVAAACSAPKPLVLPLIPYGVSYHHDDFPGTLSITNETLARLVYEVGMAAARNGIRKLLIINGHGGNAATLHFAAQQINRDSHIFTSVDSGETSDADIYAMTETPNDVHAGEIETSTTLAVRPELVDMSRAEDTIPSFSSSYLDFTSKRSIGWYAYTEKISANGVMGGPSKATPEKGERIWHLMIDHLVELVEHLKALSLEEIHQRRY